MKTTFSEKRAAFFEVLEWWLGKITFRCGFGEETIEVRSGTNRQTKDDESERQRLQLCKMDKDSEIIKKKNREGRETNLP